MLAYSMRSDTATVSEPLLQHHWIRRPFIFLSIRRVGGSHYWLPQCTECLVEFKTNLQEWNDMGIIRRASYAHANKPNIQPQVSWIFRCTNIAYYLSDYKSLGQLDHDTIRPLQVCSQHLSDSDQKKFPDTDGTAYRGFYTGNLSVRQALVLQTCGCFS